MKKWWFSLSCMLFAIAIPIFTIIAIIYFEEELLFYTLVLFSCMTPSLMLIVIAMATAPRKDEKEK